MIMNLPKNFSIGDVRLKNDAYIENGILKIRKTASFRYVVYELTFLLKGGKHRCKYCNRMVSNKKVTMDHLYPQDMGGPTITNNLLPACQKCNNEKTNMTAKEYKKYVKLKREGKQKVFLKELEAKKEDIRSRKEYQIPKSWVCEKEITTIILDIRLNEDSSQTAKYKKVQDFYLRYEYFQKPIVVDKNGFLLDGFYTVMYAKDHYIKTIPAIQLENVEVIF